MLVVTYLKFFLMCDVKTYEMVVVIIYLSDMYLLPRHILLAQEKPTRRQPKVRRIALRFLRQPTERQESVLTLFASAVLDLRCRGVEAYCLHCRLAIVGFEAY